MNYTNSLFILQNITHALLVTIQFKSRKEDDNQRDYYIMNTEHTLFQYKMKAMINCPIIIEQASGNNFYCQDNLNT